MLFSFQAAKSDPANVISAEFLLSLCLTAEPSKTFKVWQERDISFIEKQTYYSTIWFSPSGII